jgi:hypothetical protein
MAVGTVVPAAGVSHDSLPTHTHAEAPQTIGDGAQHNFGVQMFHQVFMQARLNGLQTKRQVAVLHLPWTMSELVFSAGAK